MPVGLVVSLVSVALVAGAATAKLAHEAAPLFSWMTAAGLCVVLFVLARRLPRAEPARARVLVLLVMASLTFAYLLVLGGESTPRPAGRGALDFVGFVVMLLAFTAAATAVPAALLVVALRSGRTGEPNRFRPGASPQLLAAATGAVTLLLVVVLLAAATWISSPRWRMLALLGVALGGPILLLPLGAYIYQRLISRWRVARPPHALVAGLERLKDLTEFEFDEVLCLQASFGSGRVCQVVTRPGRSTLVISELIAEDLSAAQLLAVLAHEVAHVRLHHLRRKIAWGAAAGIAWFTSVVVAQMAVVPLLPRALRFAGMLGVVLAFVAIRGLYDAFVMRRHEAEADAYAVDIVGGQALLEALDVLGASRQREALVHNRWTTHGTWERRVRRIREKSVRIE